MARYEVVQKISGCGFPERRVEARDWAAAREKLLFLMEQFGEDEYTEWERDVIAVDKSDTEHLEALMSVGLIKYLTESMIRDQDDPPLIEPEHGRWGVTFECYDLSWRNWSIRKL